MSENTDSLEGFIKETSKFLSIQDGETVKVVYKGYSILDDRFNPGKKVVSYLFQYPGTDKTIPWNKSSSKVAAQMVKMSAGDTLEISRSGVGPQSTYRIVKVA